MINTTRIEATWHYGSYQGEDGEWTCDLAEPGADNALLELFVSDTCNEHGVEFGLVLEVPQEVWASGVAVLSRIQDALWSIREAECDPHDEAHRQKAEAARPHP